MTMMNEGSSLLLPALYLILVKSKADLIRKGKGRVGRRLYFFDGYLKL